jgi:hypothetical protein
VRGGGRAGRREPIGLAFIAIYDGKLDSCPAFLNFGMFVDPQTPDLLAQVAGPFPL